MAEDVAGTVRINTDLAVPPEDSAEAHAYAELYQHLQRLHQATAGRGLSDPEFAGLDAAVKALLRPDEIARYEKPLRPHLPLSPDTIQYARNFHLTKILWARKGLERLMDDTGY